MKVSVYNGQVVQATPEYEDCRKAALKADRPLKEIQRLAAQAYTPPRGGPETIASWAQAPEMPARTRTGAARRRALSGRTKARAKRR